MPFRFQANKVHLTYKTHVDMEVIKTLMRGKRETKQFYNPSSVSLPVAMTSSSASMQTMLTPDGPALHGAGR